MKKLLIITVLAVLGLQLNAQTLEPKLEPMTLNKMNWNIALNTKFGEIDSKTSGWLGLTASYRICDCLEIGVKGEALHYDYGLNKLDQNKSYHMQSGHAGLLIDWHPFGAGDYHISVPIFMAQGEISYIYDKEYRDELIWKDEIIDKTTYHMTQFGLEFEGRIYNNLSIAVDATYSTTSPIKMLETDEKILTQFNAGISFKYNLY